MKRIMLTLALAAITLIAPFSHDSPSQSENPTEIVNSGSLAAVVPGQDGTIGRGDHTLQRTPDGGFNLVSDFTFLTSGFIQQVQSLFLNQSLRLTQYSMIQSTASQDMTVRTQVEGNTARMTVRSGNKSR